jgi:Gpi18-like mannosyltransferase
MTLLIGARRMIRSYRHLGALLALALIIRVMLTPFSAYWGKDGTDEIFWKDWMLAIHQHGLLNIFRSTNTDYVGYQYVLWLLSLINDAIGGVYGNEALGLHLLVKVPPILFDLGLIIAVYAVSRSLFEELRLQQAGALALGAAAVIALQPAVLYDSAVWSQTDSAITLAMLLALFFVVRGRTKLGFGIWAAGFLIKPHPIIILPLLLYLAWRQSPRVLKQGLATVAVVWLVGLGPWLLHGDAGNVLRVYSYLFNADYGGLTASAWNLWWLFDQTLHPQPGQAAFGFVTYRMLGFLLSASAGFLALFYLHARPNLRGALVAAAYLAFAFYLLPVSTHERYLYPFLVFMLPAAVVDKRWRLLYIAASATFFLNLVVVAPPVYGLFPARWVGSPFTMTVAALNCALFALFTLAVLPVAFPSMRALLQRSSRGARGMASTPGSIGPAEASRR